MLGFIFSGVTVILFEKFDIKMKYLRILTDTIALAGCYAIGTLWFYSFFGKAQGMSIFAVLSACVIPFILPDIVKIAAAEIIALKMPDKIKNKA